MTSFAHRVFSNHPEPQTKATVTPSSSSSSSSSPHLQSPATFDHDDFLHHIFSSAPWPLSILDDGPSPASDARNQITTVPLPHHNPNDVDGSIQALYNGFSAGSLPFHLPQA
ncbi:hypothetical protein YC2023_043540 [Brassica napus]